VDTVFVKAVFDLDCDWEGLPPVYRIYVNDELFTERTWRWTEHYLEEILQIQAAPGRYRVRVEPVGPNLARFLADNHRVEHGPGQWLDSEILEIRS
jgi:hypothetical protein